MVKLKIGAVNKSLNSHSYRATNSTTADFSFVQPLLCRLTYPNGRVKGSMRSFVRLAPLPCPTFGDIRLKSEAFWVPIDDIFPNFALLMSEKRVYDTATQTSNIVKHLPYTNNAQLQYALLYGADSKTFTMPVNDSPLENDKPVDLRTCKLMEYQMYKDMVYEPNKATGRYVLTDGVTPAYDALAVSLMQAVDKGEMTQDAAVSLYAASTAQLDFLSKQAGADYIIINNNGTTGPTNTAVIYAYSAESKALRKILLGLGYNPSIDDGTDVSILPMLAFYKAYYDRFVPFREKPWTETYAYRLITYIQSAPSVADEKFSYNGAALTISAPTPTINMATYLFTNFLINELGKCYTTGDVDFVSLHTPAVTDDIFTNGQSDRTLPLTSPDSNVIVTDQYANNNSYTPSSVNLVTGYGAATDSGTGLNAVSLVLLQKMYGYLNRDSILGNRIDTWLKSHLNSETYNEYFRRIHSSAESDVHITIGDIDSTANTYDGDANTDGTNGSVLGAYSGKGVGSGQLQFNLGGKTYGYAIILTYIMPTTSYYQGTDAQLFALDKWTIPQKEFDALGYEVTPRSFLWSDDGISMRNDGSPGNKVDAKTISGSDGFGYVPRYSGFKYAKNTVNGDFSRRGSAAGMDSFYLDRRFYHRDISSTTVNDVVTVNSTTLPTAADVWRYVQKYDFLGNYNRIFYNAGNGEFADGTSIVSQTPLYNGDDNFFVHSVLDWTENTPLRPLSISFETDVNKSDEHMTVTPA